MPKPAFKHAKRAAIAPLDPRFMAPTTERPVRAKSRHLAADTHVHPHQHAWAQVAFSSKGVIRVSTRSSTFIVPPTRAVWIPAHVEHAVAVVEDADMHALYVHQGGDDLRPNWAQCRVVEVSSLLRELLVQLALEDAAPPAVLRQQNMSHLILDELQRARTLPLGVDLPQDKRLRGLCEAILKQPGRHNSLDEWALEFGASARTLARLFRTELNSSFGQWRQQVLLARALSLAAHKRPMSHIATELGYASASAFTAMVTRTVGMPPTKFFAAQ